MKITFNELGVVTSTITDDESYRQGNVGNTLTAVFEGKNANNYIATFSYTRSDGSTIARLPMSLESSNSYKYTFNEVWFTELDGITTLTIYLYDSRNNIIANGQLQFNIEKTDFSEITSVTPDELNAWIAQLASKLDINSTQYIRFYPTIKDSNYRELPVGTTFGVKETINTGLEEKIQFYQVNSRQGLNSLSAIRVQDFTKTSGGFALVDTLYTGRFLATPNAINIPYGLYLGWRDTDNNYYFIVNGKFYTTDVNLTSGSVSVVEDAVTKITRLTNLLVDEILQVREQIYKGMGTITENNEVLNRGEIKEEFVEQVKTGTAPRVYGVDSNDEQVMYEVRNQTIPNSIVQRDANGRAYILTPTQPAHIANKGYVDGEITTLRDDLMGYTDDEVTGAIAGLKDESGKIRSDLLPSYVDDVEEYPKRNKFPTTGEKGKIYVDTSTNESWRWSGTQYIELMSGDYYLRANGEKLELDLENLEKVTPTDIVADGNTIKLYHDSIEITGQETPVTFKTVNGVSVIGVGDIETDNIQVLDTNFNLQTLVPLFADLSDLSNNITDYATLQDRMGFVKILGADSVKMQFFVGLKNSEDETAGTITYKLYQASCVINGNVVEDWTIDYENKSNSVYVDLTNNVLYRAMEFVEVPYYTYEKNIDTLMVLLAKEINEELLRKLMESKADTDGYYPQMRVGLSDNLYSPDGVVDEIPYTFRETAGTLNVETGNAEIQSVRGNTIGWNQLNENIDSKTTIGVTVTNNGDGTLVINGTSTNTVDYTMTISKYNFPTIKNHKYLYINNFVKNIPTNISNSGVYIFGLEGFIDNGIMITESKGIERAVLISISAQATYNNMIITPQVFDLTLIFGAGNEPTTVEEFRAMFPNPYYEYNPGELKSVNVTGIKTVGFNAFDGTSAKVLGGKSYYVNGTYDTLTFATELGGEETTISLVDNLFTPTSNGYVYATNVSEDFCINLSHTGYKNGTHEPYWTETRYIANALELRSAGSVYDELTKDKKITRVGVVDLGTLTWSKNTNTYASTETETFYFWTAYFDGGQKANTGNLKIKSYKPGIQSNTSGSTWENKVVATSGNVYVGVHITNTEFDTYTAEQVKEALSGVILNYELDEPVEEPLPLQNLTYKVDDFGTEEWLQTSDIPVPVAHSTLYMRNLRDDVRTLSTTYATKEELNKINTDITITHYNYDISPATAVVGTLTSEIVTSLSEVNATITRAGELYRYSDRSDSEYLTYIHASIDTSQADKPAVMRAIRINLTTYDWELLDYQLVTQAQLDTIIARISALEEK